MRQVTRTLSRVNAVRQSGLSTMGLAWAVVLVLAIAVFASGCATPVSPAVGITSAVSPGSGN